MSACCDPALSKTAEVGGSDVGRWMRVAIAGLVASQSMIFGLAVNVSPPDGTTRLAIHLILAALAIAVFLLAGLPILHRALQAARRGKIVVEQLFLAGIAGAFFASVHSTITGIGHVYYEVVAVLIAIYTFGTLLGEQRKRAVSRAEAQLRREFDQCQRLGQSGEATTVPVCNVLKGDRILVPAGSPITIDGRIVSGDASVRETALTGEPTPVVRRAGDNVLAGSYSSDGTLIIEATCNGNERDLDRLLAAVQAAAAEKSQIERVADRLTAWFLPIVLGTALLVFAFWSWKAGWMVATFNALAVLLVACPCALGLATPIGIWSALATLARNGLVSHKSDLIEVLARTDVVVFDKTGTLSEEEMVIADFVTGPDIDRDTLRAEVAALERHSPHPIARAFHGIRTDATAITSQLLAGIGLEGTVRSGGGEVRLTIGNRELSGNGFDDLLKQLHRMPGETHEVRILRNGSAAGIALLREKLRDTATSSIRDLESQGVDVRIMTGDRAEAAQRLDLPNVQAGMSPEEKAAEVQALRAAGKTVLFVGDGINDAPAIGAADAGISLGTASGLARETAWAELSAGNLQAIADAVRTARGTVQRIRRNILFAAFYNLAGITLAATGILHPVVAALLMLGSSLTVTWNALRQGGNAESPPRPSPAASWRKLLLPGAAGAILAVQGPIIAMLGGFSRGAAAGFVLLFLGAGAVLFFLMRQYARDPLARMSLSMFSIGGLGMLAGWWVDAGFAPVVRDGICLCGCAASIMGAGLIAKFNWMNAGMIAAALPMYFELDPALSERTTRVRCWIAGLAGMLIGMELAGIVMAMVPVAANPQLHFFATYAAMLTGMTIGMVVACQAARTYLLRGVQKAKPDQVQPAQAIN